MKIHRNICEVIPTGQLRIDLSEQALTADDVQHRIDPETFELLIVLKNRVSIRCTLEQSQTFRDAMGWGSAP